LQSPLASDRLVGVEAYLSRNGSRRVVMNSGTMAPRVRRVRVLQRPSQCGRCARHDPGFINAPHDTMESRNAEVSTSTPSRAHAGTQKKRGEVEGYHRRRGEEFHTTARTQGGVTSSKADPDGKARVGCLLASDVDGGSSAPLITAGGKSRSQNRNVAPGFRIRCGGQPLKSSQTKPSERDHRPS